MERNNRKWAGPESQAAYERVLRARQSKQMACLLCEDSETDAEWDDAYNRDMRGESLRWTT